MIIDVYIESGNTLIETMCGLDKGLRVLRYKGDFTALSDEEYILALLTL